MRTHMCSKCREKKPVAGGYCRKCANEYMRNARKTGKWKHDGGEYKHIRIGNKVYRQHRLVLGISDPKIHVHHINGDPRDNRPENLIAVTAKEHYKIHNCSS